MGYNPCMMADFENGLISWIFSVFWSGFFAQNNSKWFEEWILTCFVQLYYFNQSEDFAWAIALGWWPIFKMVSFVEYLVFFGAFFFARNNSKWFVEWILTCFWNFNFWPKLRIWMGYSFCMVIDFQNGLISRMRVNRPRQTDRKNANGGETEG